LAVFTLILLAQICLVINSEAVQQAFGFYKNKVIELNKNHLTNFLRLKLL